VWILSTFASSALTLLVGQQEGHPACKNWVVGCWHGYLSGARCRLAYDPANAIATHCLLLQWNLDWFYLSGTCSPRVVPDKGPLNGCVCVCVCMCVCVCVCMCESCQQNNWHIWHTRISPLQSDNERSFWKMETTHTLCSSESLADNWVIISGPHRYSAHYISNPHCCNN